MITGNTQLYLLVYILLLLILGYYYLICGNWIRFWIFKQLLTSILCEPLMHRIYFTICYSRQHQKRTIGEKQWKKRRSHNRKYKSLKLILPIIRIYRHYSQYKLKFRCWDFSFRHLHIKTEFYISLCSFIHVINRGFFSSFTCVNKQYEYI